jgi:hypothetical protein
MTLKRNPVQDCIEVMAKAKQEVVERISDAALSDKDYQFLSKRLSNPATKEDDFVYKHVSSPTTTAHAQDARDLETAATATRQEKEPGEEADCYLKGKQMPSDEESLE